MTAGTFAGGDRQMQAGIGEEGRIADILNITPAQPHIEELVIVEFAQPVDHAAILPGARKSVDCIANTVEEARGRTARCEDIDFQSAVDHAHGISPFRRGDPSSSMGFRSTPVIVRHPQGRWRFTGQVLGRAEPGGRGEAADPAERSTGGRINRSTIAFSQNLIDQSNECF
jgi:hypothetical protein